VQTITIVLDLSGLNKCAIAGWRPKLFGLSKNNKRHFTTIGASYILGPSYIIGY